MDTLSQLLDDIHLSGGEFRYVQAAAPWGFDFRAEGLASFHLILGGSAVLYQAGEEPLRLEAGDMAIVTSGRDHRMLDEPRPVTGELPNLADIIRGHDHDPLMLGGEGVLTSMLSARFRFDADLAKPLLAALPPLMLIQGVSDEPPEWLRIGLEFLANEGLGRPGRQAIVNRLAGILFIECVRDHLEALPVGASTWLRALRDPALSPVLSVLHQRPEYPWTVPELAGVACLSRSAFAERFTAVMGQPPLSYLAEHRMRLAVWQLQHTSQPICRIAEMVGYASETAFSQAFKRIYGSSPSRFRQQKD
ncbi:MAG: AraC family transcriptional regulator [bacterium]|nr:AraC family transcriptional regulator [bacterium]